MVDHATGEFTPTQSPNQPFQLLVKPLLKSTVSQRDTSGVILDAFVASGRSFSDILQKIWDEFKPRLKGLAAKTDSGWSLDVPDIADWTSSMHLRHNKKVVDATKSEQEWNQWLVKVKDKTVMLVVFEYGTKLGRQQDFDDFTTECIRPQVTDRAGATAETSLRDVPVDSRTTEHMSNLSRSATLALDGVSASIDDIQQLRRYVDICESNLMTRKRVIEAFIRDIPPPPAHSVVDPMPRIENVEDIEHKENE
ncbi:hypothetical protein DYB30_010688 [Aphanomyces astaci]|uniref:Uncharacterized protein n=1 Tax=Aphanomyces astaci TaxID=112090 RepID=A0A397DRU1_APHAT|nr:hypothetical protein DYB30_010688 [Aphanomyces astaci]